MPTSTRPGARPAPPRRHSPLRAFAVLAVLALLGVTVPPAAADTSYTRISGAGSTWSQNMVDQWVRNVRANYGMVVDFSGTGSSDGRNQFRNGTVQFAVSEIPYGLRDGQNVDSPPNRDYAYMPIVAGGTAFMYNLRIGSRRVTNLRLSGEVIARIFTRDITRWNDPAIAEDNPGLNLPATPITPVVRSDGSGTSAQFTTWLETEHRGIWQDYCAQTGLNPCTQTSNYPTVNGMVAQSGSLGVSGYVSRNNAVGSITYVEYSYALNTGFPVAKVLNAQDYYVEPTAEYVAVGLLRARINEDPNSSAYLTQDLRNVYRHNDRRAYPLSSYSYMILPTSTETGFTQAHGRTLGAFADYFLCEGQRQAGVLGYSPLPINLVEAGFDQIERIPGADVENVNIASCNNPTFSSDGSNTLAENAPQPPDCDRRGPTQCASGTGGAEEETPVDNSGGGGGGGGDNGGGGGGGGDNGGGGGGGGGGQDSDGDGIPDSEDPDPDSAASGDPLAGGGAVDPETGEVIGGDGLGAGGQPVAGIPVSLMADSGWGLRHTLMLLAGVSLIALVVGPPLVSRLVTARRRS
ncbi:phosphate ABC transporter substrate-binding protein PstS [Allonocardiopsis opalescens]|uniref:Phosphate ABC transporter substrate-binding protein (PhoT family) n=1 Tax=Allonocardiopsis opalescens TaxID=1144618 RepID=A0A2T0PS59_9ACTN|nr:phosphate ABC transporter substrate-binding protein PstS [Allonocardiopsis opalescens]PRX91739.1 phosphate ABC transporter substrate-binding protein (PhoT family) [Allonocardiopsis opalescens]